MCIPAAPLMLASAAISAAGSIAGGLQANAQGKAEAQIARMNAKREIDAARQSEEIGKDERTQFFRGVSQTKGSQIAAMAANGIDVGFGIGEKTQQDTAMLAAEDAANLYRNINNRTMGRVIQASNYDQEALASRSRGKAALLGGILQGASTLVGAAAQFKGKKATLGQGG